MNIGPQPNGELPAVALQRLKELGEWTATYGETIYGTDAGDVKPQPWGVTTKKDGKLFVHVLAPECLVPGDGGNPVLYLPLDWKVKSVTEFIGGAKVEYRKTSNGIAVVLPRKIEAVDYVLVVQ